MAQKHTVPFYVADFVFHPERRPINSDRFMTYRFAEEGEAPPIEGRVPMVTEFHLMPPELDVSQGAHYAGRLLASNLAYCAAVWFIGDSRDNAESVLIIHRRGADNRFEINIFDKRGGRWVLDQQTFSEDPLRQ